MKFTDYVRKWTNMIFTCERGGGGGDDPPPQPSQQEVAQANLEAQIATLPKATQVQYDILKNPEYGLQAQTQLAEDVKRNVYSAETDVRDQLVQNVLSQLISPTGISSEQQASIDASRVTAQDELIKAMRERANLSGGLYGGRSAAAEAESVGKLQNQFAQEDIEREERARLNAIQSAIPVLQMLYPSAGLVTPNYINPVASGDTAYSGEVSMYNQQLANQAAQEQAQAALYGSLFNALGTAGGGYLSTLG